MVESISRRVKFPEKLLHELETQLRIVNGNDGSSTDVTPVVCFVLLSLVSWLH